ncbi:MAG: 1-acyl-sn-glycerol-3-phosphate acyltransferase, partial [Bacteroidota bacterium]
VIGPHTANMDFVLGIIARSVLGLQGARYLGKSQLFKFPLGILFKALGGYPVDRSKHNNTVDAVVDIFNKHERFGIALAPEGTRSKVDRLKTGFYHIAQKANVPIYMVGFDYGSKSIIVREPFLPSDDIEKDFGMIIDFFSEIKGKYPANGIDKDMLQPTIKYQK